MRDLEQRSSIELAIDRYVRQDQLTRRAFIHRTGRGMLAVGALMTIPGILAACQSGGSESGIRWLNWPAYMDLSEDEASFPSIEAFIEASGIDVEYNEGLLDNADFLAQYSPDLRAGNNTAWDVMSPGGWVVERMVRNDWLEELDHSMLPNWTANCADYAKGLWFDPDNTHSVWYQGGITGIAYDPELTGREITKFDDLLDPEFSGRVGGFSDMRDMFGLTLLSLGVEPENATIEDVEAAQQKLLGAPEGQFRGFYGNEYYDALAAGDLAISVAWGGDVTQMNLYDNPNILFVVPETGGMRWNDNLIIPKGGANLEAAHQLIDYYYSVDAAAMLSSYVGYFSPVTGVDTRILEDAAAAREDGDTETADLLDTLAPTVVLTDEQSANTFTDKVMTEEEEAAWNDLFETVIGA
ncbi:MAG TPA: spermidine/putrescine ABC transporter substrate-binding protein [Candidatus Limnocylindria bacterium]|jgi:spermidine/putrescine transport system substrate-binding protein